jgi:hypothetical protein
MKVLLSAVFAAGLLAGCISSSSPPPPPAKTTVVVPQGSGATVVCNTGNPPPCDCGGPKRAVLALERPGGGRPPKFQRLTP